MILALAIAYPAAIAILFYFAFLRPVQQERSRQRKQLASLEIGDEVLTQGGLIGTVEEIRVPEERGPTELVLDLGGVQVRAHASAVVERLARPEAAADTEPKKQAMAAQTGPAGEQRGT